MYIGTQTRIFQSYLSKDSSFNGAWGGGDEIQNEVEHKMRYQMRYMILTKKINRTILYEKLSIFGNTKH